MRRALIVSLVFHLCVLLLALVVMPKGKRPLELSETPIDLDLVALAEKANPPPKRAETPRPAPDQPPLPQPVAPQQMAPQQMAPAPKPETKPEAKPEPKPEAKPETKPEAKPDPKPAPPARSEADARPVVRPSLPKPQPEPEAKPKPEVKPQSRPAPPKPEPVKPDLPKPEPVKASPPKPEPPKPEPPKPEPPKPESVKPKPPAAVAARPTPSSPPATTATAATTKQPQPAAEKAQAAEKGEAADFSSVVKAVGEMRREPAKPAAPAGAVEKPATAAASLEEQVARALGSGASAQRDTAAPVTQGELDAVRRQIERCWSLPASAKDADNVVVSIRVQMNADGTPRSAQVDGAGAASGNPFYRVAAESALRAVLNPRCHPFKLPPDKYERWRTMTLVFNPKEMAGT